MFLPARMKKITALVLDEYKDALVKELHELGVVELKAAESKENYISRARIDESIREITPLLIRIGYLLDLLKRTEVSKKKSFELPKPPEKEKIRDLPLTEIVSRAQEILSQIEEPAREIGNQLTEIEERVGELSSEILLLEKVKVLDFDLSFLGESTYTFTTVGTIPPTNVEELARLENTIVASREVEEVNIALVVGLIKEKEKIYERLKAVNFQEFTLPKAEGTPTEIIGKFKREIEELHEKNQALLERLSEISHKFKKKLLVLQELLEIEKQRAEATGIFGRTARTYIVQGFIPEKEVERAIRRMEEKTEKHIFITVDEPEELEEEIPVLLDNPKPIRPFEIITEMFALPKYNEFDPTPLIAPAFLIFFGIMLTDAVYGIVVAAVGYSVMRILGRMSQGARDLGIILIAAGISAFIWGVLFGSYFGDFFSPKSDGEISIGTKLTGISIPALWLDPYQKELKYGLSPVIVILLMALLMGFIHINIGNLIGLYKSWQKGNLQDTLSHLWLIFFQLGLVALLLKYTKIGGVFLSIGLGMLFYSSGVLGFFGITGWLGDSLSYARLLALALATGGIAIAVNILVKMVSGIPIIGIALAIVVFLFGHIFNIALNALGAFIHSLRLHYVEFFGKFYEGGGNKFKPFKVERTYTEIEVDS